MGRDKTVSVKEQILDKSIQLFLRKGYNGTTIKDITDAVNITKGAFYWHFKSKDELLSTIVAHYENTFTDTIIPAVRNSEGTFLTKMKYAHKWATEFAYHNRDLCMCFLTIAAEMVGSETDIEKKIRETYSKYLTFLKELLEFGKKEGYIRDDLDIESVANVINSIHNGSLLEWYIHYDEIDGSLFARTYLDVVLFGICKTESKTKISK
jgi:AcrR family transcriptional regulator